MNLIKKIFLVILHYLFKIVNIIGIFIVILFALLLYIVIFEVPINFFNKYIEEKVFHNLVKIEKIYLKWDYSVKKPVIILNNLQYKDDNNKVSFTFKQLGVTFDITKLVINHKFYPTYINLEGFELAGIRYKDNTLAFNLQDTPNIPLKEVFHNMAANKNDSIQINKNVASSNNISHELSWDNIEKEGIYNIIMNLKKQNEILSLLNRIDIDNSTILFKDELKNKEFFIDMNHLSFINNTVGSKILIKSNTNIEDINLKKTIYIKGGVVTDKQKNVFFNYSVDNIPPELLLIYADCDLSKKVRTAGLFINANIDGRYVFSSGDSGFKTITTDISMDEGEIFIKDLLLDRLKIISLKTQVYYNSNYNKINISNFKINISNTTPLKLLALKGGSIAIKNISFNADLDIKKSLYDVNDVKVVVAEQLLEGKGSYNKGDTVFKLSTVNAINITDIKKIWSPNLLHKVRHWVVNNINKGVINKAQIDGNIHIGKEKVELKKLEGSVLASNVEVRYLSGMPTVFAPKAKLEFDQKHLNIKYFEAKTGNLFSKTGEVNLLNEFPYKQEFSPLLKVDVKAEGKVVDGLAYINNKPLYLLKKSHLDINSFSGDMAGNIYLEYSFAAEKVRNIDINLVGHNISFINAFKNKDVTKANLNITVKDTSLLVYGNGEYYDMPVNLYVNAVWDEKVPYSLKLNVDLKDVPYSKVNNLNLLPDMLKDKLEGTVNISTEMQQIKSSNKKIVTSSLDLTHSHIKKFPYLDYSKPFEEPAKAIIKLDFIDNKLFEIKQFTLTSNNLVTQMRIAFTEDKSTNVVIDKFIMKNIADIKGYLYLKENNYYMNFNGKYLNVEWLYNGYKKDKDNFKTKTTKKNQEQPSNEPNTSVSNNYVIKVNIKKAESNGIVLNNFYVNCDLVNKDLNSLVVSGDLNKEDNITVVYDKPSKKIAYNISNLGVALKFLNVSSKIKRGNLIGQINFLQDKNKNILTDGTIFIKSFNVGMIPFSSGKLSFVGKNNDFNIMNVSLKGSVVGGALSGTYNGDKQYLMLSGYITPIWSASHLLTSVPILGDFLKSNFAQSILSSGVKEQNKDTRSNKGAVNIPFTLYGDIKNLQYNFSDNKKKKTYKAQKNEANEVPSLNLNDSSVDNIDILGTQLLD